MENGIEGITVYRDNQGVGKAYLLLIVVKVSRVECGRKLFATNGVSNSHLHH
jgi:hypothetical protein